MAEVMGLGSRPESLPDTASMPNVGAMQAKLLKADFHGCIIKGDLIPFNNHLSNHPLVKECKNASRVDCSGIVVHETSNTFKIVTRNNELKGMITLPLLSPHTR